MEILVHSLVLLLISNCFIHSSGKSPSYNIIIIIIALSNLCVVITCRGI